tara:strand:+ start:5985 stop:7634 length:1650 start_codon:yes stop_codon:yes gene_type:complete
MSNIGHIEFKQNLIWVEQIHPDGSLINIVNHDLKKQQRPTFNKIKSRIYGYGGGEFTAVGDTIFCCSGKGIFTSTEYGEEEVLTGCFGDLVSADKVWAVQDFGDHAGWVMIDPKDYTIKSSQLESNQFISNIAPRPGNSSDFAYIVWEAPNMPWDCSQMVLNINQVETVINNPYGNNIQQIDWIDSTQLALIMQVDNWWNLVTFNIKTGQFTKLVIRTADINVPLWQRGQRTMWASGQMIFFVEQTSPGCERIIKYDLLAGKEVTVPCKYDQISQLAVNNGKLVVQGGSQSHKGGMCLLEENNQYDIVCDPISPEYEIRKIGDKVCGWLYEIKSPRAILISCHGGPTGQHSLTADDKFNEFARSGILYASLDYRGSTGRGQQFRNEIYNAWGVVDVDDCCWLIGELKSRYPSLPIFLRGNSAGALTCILTARRIKIDGLIMRYPVIDITELMQHTPTFERGYLKRLLPDAITHLDLVDQMANSSADVLIQQGDQDPVVAINGVNNAVKRMQQKGLSVTYYIYKGEGHGFKANAARDIADNRELEFILSR